jgi:subtilisin-like proprotein convertase family protein
VNDSFNITSATVTLNITNNYDGALFIYLQSPTGVKIYLVNDAGGAGKNFTNTVFADSAVTAIDSGKAPFTGTFKPESVLAALNGLQAKGTWKLVIQDTIPATSGQLVSWTLTFNTAGGAISTQASSSKGLTISSYSPLGSTGEDGAWAAESILAGLPGGHASSSSAQETSTPPPATVYALDQLFGSGPTLTAHAVADLALLASGRSTSSTPLEAPDELVFNTDD